MPRHQNTHIVLQQIRELGAGALVDDDGDIVVHVDGKKIFVSVNDMYVHARMFFQTSAPLNALVMVARKLHQRLIVGRLVYPDEGGGFVIDYAHRYDGVPLPCSAKRA